MLTCPFVVIETDDDEEISCGGGGAPPFAFFFAPRLFFLPSKTMLSWDESTSISFVSSIVFVSSDWRGIGELDLALGQVPSWFMISRRREALVETTVCSKVMSSARTASVEIAEGEDGEDRPFIGLECCTSESFFISSSLL